MPSFDIVSNYNVQELDNAINITSREVMTRYDLKDQKCSINFNKNEKNYVKTVEENTPNKIIKGSDDLISEMKYFSEKTVFSTSSS